EGPDRSLGAPSLSQLVPQVQLRLSPRLFAHHGRTSGTPPLTFCDSHHERIRCKARAIEMRGECSSKLNCHVRTGALRCLNSRIWTNESHPCALLPRSGSNDGRRPRQVQRRERPNFLILTYSELRGICKASAARSTRPSCRFSACSIILRSAARREVTGSSAGLENGFPDGLVRSVDTATVSIVSPLVNKRARSKALRSSRRLPG